MSCERLTQILSFDFPELLPDIVQDHLVQAAQEIADYELFQCEIDLTGDLQDCVGDYDFEHKLPLGMTTRSIISVEYCGCCIDPVDPKCNPCPIGYERCGVNSIRLHPTPNAVAGQDLKVCLALEPESGACELPDHICDQFRAPLTDFVRASILCMPNQTWSDFGASRKYAGLARKNLRRRVSAYTDERTSELQQMQGERWLV